MSTLATPPAPSPPARRPAKRWTKAEFNAAVERGWFAGSRIYLYRGELVEMPAMGTLHARGIRRVAAWLIPLFEPAFAVRHQSPFELPDESMPQPEFVVCTADQADRRPHPNAAVLVIEVADSSVELDRDAADDYAAAGVPDYWIANVRDRRIEVYRDPRPDPASPTGHRYGLHRVYAAGETLAPLARPEAVVAVGALTDVG